MAWYKIADGPLDIVGKTLEVLTSESDVPIVTNSWRDNGVFWELRVRSDSPYIRETICVLDNVILDSSYVSNGTPPLTGIFVSENIRSISIPGSEEVHKIDAKYLTSSIVIPFTKGVDGNITCDLSMEELNTILRNHQPDDICPALDGVLGVPGYSFYYDESAGSNSMVFAFQYFGADAGRLSIDDGGDDPKTITSQSTFNLGYKLLFVYQDGDVREEEASYSVPLWTNPSL